MSIVLVELAINDFIRAQPDSTPEEDQRLIDKVVQPLNDIGERLPELEEWDSKRGPIH